MTAVALLFAIYMVRPSPFCILDEMDAPLDESNINRFIKVLDRFVSQSQFIIITHNKRTIAKADILYGVTMEERGISKLVGMKLEADRGSDGQLIRNRSSNGNGSKVHEEPRQSLFAMLATPKSSGTPRGGSTVAARSVGAPFDERRSRSRRTVTTATEQKSHLPRCRCCQNQRMLQTAERGAATSKKRRTRNISMPSASCSRRACSRRNWRVFIGAA
jgi:energy-coupling factor transporter ATP-binding protein EcfA2